MDIECVPLLPRVCEVLADSGRSLPDDTSLEKLLDWFTRLTKTGGSLLGSCPCLTGFISAVIGNKDSDPSVLSFTLKLTGLIAATEDGFRSLQESLLLNEAFNLQHWQEAGLWDDPCIRIGWIQGLKSLLQHPKALSFFAQSDFIEPLLQLQTDSSLFVASAANQMLAHILLFFQPVLSEGCNGEGKLNGIKSASLEQPVVPMEASAEYTALVKLISKYLKESLIPTDNKQLHQSLQSLKLLALLLHQARPPLQDELLQTVTGSLEEVVKSGCSELTLPLMDVILAAYSPRSERVQDQRVGHLLSSMLNINKPSDLIQAAAAFLRSGLHDAHHSVQAVRMLLLPLDIVTGHTLLGTNISVEDHGGSMAEQLKSKTSCISLICICLTHTPHITLLPSDILPCPPAVIVIAVLSLLRICSGVSPPSSSGCSEACRNVISSSKVQKCALEALTSLSSSQGAQEKISEVVVSLIEYLDNPDSEPTVLHKSYQALLKWISVCTDISFITDQLRRDLADVVKKRVCDMRWEVRDSSVEFLGQMTDVGVPLKSAKEMCNVTEALLGGCCTTPLLREALQDTESYVRASAISALAKTMTHSWQQGAALSQEETEIVNRLLEILSEDTEGFSRRAVVQYFISWFSSSSSSSPLLMQSVRCVLSLGGADLDWEVKFHTLELAELLMDEAFSGQRGYRKDSDTHDAPQHPYGVISEQTFTLHTHTATEEVGSDLGRALKSLVEQGVISALLSGLVDCDRPVGLKACRLLITLRETVCSLLGEQDASRGTVSRVSCELPEQGWGREIRKLLGDKKAQETDTLTEGAMGEVCAVDVCELLRSLGLDEKRDVLTQSSDHIHNSPLSLLQDILTVRVAHSHPDAETEQEVIVDCY
ncbi:BRCA1-associated ATM activator 1 isoform X2 [Cheilinus undulatus]|uniref:BRCA1-associated ATM activator 1 isoform X2 n=1 Tax=Cheilinus undulatus TaxID=241271 RepID=UPI001BD4FDC4|nr:BRCA1-associated ATM activator 1 isoform X2 [Cheilinus undulatus]